MKHATKPVVPDRFAHLVGRALERMAFVITERLSTPPGELLAGCAAHAMLELRGAANATLCVSATPGMVREIASGMLGVDAEEIDVDHHAVATVAELANVLGGELVMQLTGGDTPTSVGLPREAGAGEAGALLQSGAAAAFHVALRSEGGQLLVVVRAG